MQSNAVERITRTTSRVRDMDELEALRHRKGKHHKTSRGRVELECV